MTTLVGIAVLLGFFSLAWALDTLLDHLFLKAGLAVGDRLQTVFRNRYRSQSDPTRYDRFRSKRKSR